MPFWMAVFGFVFAGGGFFFSGFSSVEFFNVFSEWEFSSRIISGESSDRLWWIINPGLVRMELCGAHGIWEFFFCLFFFTISSSVRNAFFASTTS